MEEKKWSVYKICFITNNWNGYYKKIRCENTEEALNKWKNETRTKERIECEANNWAKACIRATEVSEIITFFER